MRLSYNQLSKYVEHPFNPHELADQLTMLGFEVEEVGPAHEYLEKVVVGRVLSVEPHAKADKLQVTTVDVGRDQALTVVCGAPNIKAGLLVAVATPGSRLPRGQAVEATTIRGVRSEGMICSAAELLLSDIADEILVLNGESSPGTPLSEASGMKDWFLDVTITPNRPDCMSVLGLAREIACITGNKVRKPVPTISEGARDVSSWAAVEIEAPTLCPRYSARLVDGVKVGPSPAWLVRCLEAAGMRSVNNVVDVTNFVLLELGHPLHAFDYASLSGGKIVVRTPRMGEARFRTLDGLERELDSEMLLICDAEKPVALGGIMGGENSEVCEDTTTILLESAYFNPTSIRRTAKKLQISTESSQRFERGMDPNGTVSALDRAAALIQEVAGGEIANGALDVYPQKIEPPNVRLNLARARKLLGADISDSEIVRILSMLELSVAADNGEIEVTVPTFRHDLTRYQDLLEEIARVAGYDQIPTKTVVWFDQLNSGNMEVAIVDELRDSCFRLGLSEAVTYSTIPQAWSARFLPDGSQPVEVTNPISEDQAILRPSLIPGLLNAAQWNLNRMVSDVRLFEVGKVFLSSEQDGQGTRESWSLAGVVTGARRVGNWRDQREDVDFYDVKGLLEALFELSSVPSTRRKLAEAPLGCWAADANATATGDELLGQFGRIAASVADQFGIGQPIFAFEVSLPKLIEVRQEGRPYQPLPKFPPLNRDLAFVVQRDIVAADMEEAIKSAGGPNLSRLQVFDVYEGEQVAEEQKSIAFNLDFRSYDRTLTEDEVEVMIESIVKEMKKRFGATLR